MTGMTIKAYDIISDFSPENLAVTVRLKLEEGWQPFGAPFLQQGGVFQAIVQGDNHLDEISAAVSEIATRIDSLETTIGRK